MRGPISDFWGKLTKTAGGLEWHPWIDHSADVAAVCEALLQRTLMGRRLATLGGRDALTDSDIARIAAMTAGHDVGKPNHGFQNKADASRRPHAGHVQPIIDVLHASGSVEQRRLIDALALAEMETWAEGDAGCELLEACICHHGRPVQSGDGPDVELWQPQDGRNPFEGISRLSAKLPTWFPAAFDRHAKPLPSKPEFVHGLCGLVTLADWIGSDSTFFRYSEPGDGDRMAFARRQASAMLWHIGIDASLARAALEHRPDFSEVFGFRPNAMQHQILDLPVTEEGQLIILESQTGSGKTEAAVAHFLSLFTGGLVDGMYFALPTRTAAYQIYRRVVAAVERGFPDLATRPPVILAVPGYLDDRSAPLAPFDALWPDEGRDH